MGKIIFPVFFICEALGIVLYGSPLGVDAPMSWLTVVGAFLYFLVFLTGVIAWGQIAAIFLKLNSPIFAPPLGVLLFCFIGALLGHLGFIGFSNRSLALFLINLGPLLLLIRNWRSPLPRFMLTPPKLNLSLLFLGLCSFLFFLLTFTLDSMPDPLWYHLTGARLFSEAGKIYLPIEFPIALKSGFWEYLFLWGNMLLGGPSGGGLIAGQFFGQWTHFFLGFIAALLGWWHLVKKLFPLINKDWLYLLFLTSFLLKDFSNISYLAKNDLGATALTIFGFLFFLEERVLLAGLCLGAGFATKYTMAFSILGFFMFYLWPLTRKKILPLLIGFSIGSAPVLLRNYFFTENPFFPVWNQVFHSPWLGPSWENIRAFSGGNGFSFIKKIPQLEDLLLQSPFCLAALFLVLPAVWLGKISLRFACMAVMPVLFFILSTGVKAEPRLLGPSLLFFTLLGACSIYELGKSIWSKLPLWQASCLFLLPSILCVKFPYMAPKLIYDQLSPPEEIRFHTGGAASAWLRINTLPGEKVASAGETRLYYLLPLGITRIWDDPNLDRALAKEKSAQGIFRVLAEKNIRYLLLTNALWDVYYDPLRWNLIAKVSLQLPEAIPFATDTSRVIDVPKILRLIEKHDAMPRNAIL